MTAAALIPTLVLGAAVPRTAAARREPGLAEGTAAASMPTAPALAPVAELPPAVATVEAAPAPPVEVVAPAVVPPPVVACPPRWTPPPPPTASLKEARGFMLGGAVMLGFMYGFTALGGAIVIDKARKRQALGQPSPDRRRESYGRALLVPLAGPFVAMSRTDAATDRWLDAAAGLLQLGGAAMFVIGVAQHRRARLLERYRVSAGMQAGGAQLSFSGRF